MKNIKTDGQPELLYHATSERCLAGIAREGMREGSYWTSDEGLLDYYLETVSDDGDAPVALRVRFDSLRRAAMQPDRPGLDEPIMSVVRQRIGLGRCDGEGAVWDAWQRSGRTALDCLRLIGSVRYRDAVVAQDLGVRRGSDPRTPVAGAMPRKPRP